jgi:hypothetical protein
VWITLTDLYWILLGERRREWRYIDAIIDTALPFLEEFLIRITEGAVSLPHLLKEWIYREVKVAQLVLSDLRNEGKQPESYVLKTLQHHALWTYAGWPSPLDDLKMININGETDWEAYVERQEKLLQKKWDDGRIVEVCCPVCDSDPGDGSYVRAQVLLEDSPIANNLLIAEGFNCFVCGLRIVPEERFLARHFVGEIPEETATEYLKDIGQL